MSEDISSKVLGKKKYAGTLLTDEECDEIVNKTVQAFKEALDKQVDKIIKELKEQQQEQAEVKPSHQKFHYGDGVLTTYWNPKAKWDEWKYDIYSHYSESMKQHRTVSGIFDDTKIRPFNKGLLGKSVEC